MLFIFCGLVAVGVGAIFWYLHYTRTHISTDDAFVDGRIHVIAPKVAKFRKEHRDRLKR